MMQQEDALVVRGSLCAAEVMISEFVQEKARQANLSNKRTWELLLALDEICSSLIAHNGSSGSNHLLRLTWRVDNGVVTILLADNGIPFNPLREARDEADIEEETRELGGMNHQMLGLMIDEMAYEHRDGWNIITLRKRLRCRHR